MPAILITAFEFLAPFFIKYAVMAFEFITSLTLKQFMWLCVAIGLVFSHSYVYDMGKKHERIAIEQKAVEDAKNKAKKKQTINNSAIDDNTVINELLKGSF